MHRLYIALVISTLISLTSCENRDIEFRSFQYEIMGQKQLSQPQEQDVLKILHHRFIAQGVENENLWIEFQGNKLIMDLRAQLSESIIDQLVCTKTSVALFETLDNSDIYPLLDELNTALRDKGYITHEPGKIIDSVNSHGIELVDNEISLDQYAAENPLWNVLRPAIYQGEDGLYYIGEGPTIGFASIDDTAQINKILTNDMVKFEIGNKFIPVWANEPYDIDGMFVQLYALKKNGNLMTFSAGNVLSAKTVSNEANGFELSIQPNEEAADQFERLTSAYVHKSIAITCGARVYSAPRIETVIEGGNLSITTGSGAVDGIEGLKSLVLSEPMPVKFFRVGS